MPHREILAESNNSSNIQDTELSDTCGTRFPRRLCSALNAPLHCRLQQDLSIHNTAEGVKYIRKLKRNNKRGVPIP
jgi:hypothetical protein